MKLTIGIIDDDLVSQYATQYCIEQVSKECRIYVCDSGEEAIALFTDMQADGKELPDVLFLDLTMEGMDGWQFLDAIQPIVEGHSKMEIYILSAFINTKDREKATQHPMIKGYFDKPLSKNMMNTILLSKTF